MIADDVDDSDRYVLSSRLRRKRRTSTWRPADGIEVPMPVVFDLALVDTLTGADVFRFDATVDLVDGSPALVRFEASAATGLDLARLQREFRWATPVDVVTRLVPAIVAAGGDPFDHDYPVDGFPEVIDAHIGPANRALSDEFLEGVAREYLALGRGYADAIALTCVVCGRTMEWRKRWARTWDDVRYCSTACRKRGLRPVDHALEASIERLLDERAGGATICPSEAARDVGGDEWRPLLEPARAAARRLCADGRVVITQGGRTVDPSTAKGPVRIRRA